MDDKRVKDPRIKITGVRVQRSFVLMMRAVAKERGVPISALYNQIVGEFLMENRPPQKD